MLRAPTFKERPQFERFPDGTCTWFGAPCRVISVISEETSYASICFVHENYAQSTFHYLDNCVDLAKIYEANLLPGMEEFQSHFLCIGFYLHGKLVGFWDMPLNWMEGAKLLSWADLQSPEFQALWNAAKNYAATHPEGTSQNTFKAMP
jgi:hypothetical protein